MGFNDVRTVELDDLLGVSLTSGDVTIELVWGREPASRAAQLAGAERRLDHLAIAVPDLAAAMQELADAGVETTPPIATAIHPAVEPQPWMSSS